MKVKKQSENHSHVLVPMSQYSKSGSPLCLAWQWFDKERTQSVDRLTLDPGYPTVINSTSNPSLKPHSGVRSIKDERPNQLVPILIHNSI